jgi:hypothetical protein
MKIKLISLVVLGCILASVTLLGFTGCSSTTTVTATVTQTATSAATLDVVNKFIAAEDKMFGSGDNTSLLAVEDTNIVIHMMAFGDVKGNTAHVAAVAGIVKSAESPITHDWTNPIATNDIGAVQWVEHDKIGGKDVSYQGTYFLKVKDGKITEAWLVSDMLTYFLAAGIVQYKPAPAK